MLNLTNLLQQRRIVFCGGKGGVGKTTLSCALAVKAANSGKKTLLVSTDPAHSLADAFSQKIGAQTQTLMPNLDVLELDPDAEVDAYLNRVLGHLRRYVHPDQAQELSRQLNLSKHSPGAQEAALLERLARLVDDGLEKYDLLLFDTAPTGHTLRLLTLPEVMAVWTQGLLKSTQRSNELGSVLKHLTPSRSVPSLTSDAPAEEQANLDERQQEILSTLLERQSLFQRLRSHLTNASTSAFVFVLTPEKLPLVETQRAVQALQAAKIKVAGALVNKVMPDEGLAGEFWTQRLAQQAHYLAAIEAGLQQVPLKLIALQAMDIQGLPALQRLAGQL